MAPVSRKPALFAQQIRALVRPASRTVAGIAESYELLSLLLLLGVEFHNSLHGVRESA